MPRNRIEVDPQLAPVRLDSQVLHELCAHALQAQPEECCGLVTGTAAAPFRQVHRCRNVMTAKHLAEPATFPRDGSAAYFMDEADYLRAQREAREAGERITAVYHSHVGAGAYFSEMDQEFAEHALFPFPDAAQIVLAVWERRVVGAGIFQRDPASGRYIGAPLAIGVVGAGRTQEAGDARTAEPHSGATRGG